MAKEEVGSLNEKEYQDRWENSGDIQELGGVSAGLEGSGKYRHDKPIEDEDDSFQDETDLDEDLNDDDDDDE